jgi:hypothetical protein
MSLLKVPSQNFASVPSIDGYINVSAVTGYTYPNQKLVQFIILYENHFVNKTPKPRKGAGIW